MELNSRSGAPLDDSERIAVNKLSLQDFPGALTLLAVDPLILSSPYLTSPRLLLL
jgi:hypothetical protein